MSTKYTAIITTGIEAAIAISRSHTHSRIIMAMLPEEDYLALIASGKIVCKPGSCQVIFLNQPVNRQLRLIKLAFPDKRQIAIFSSSDSIAIAKQAIRSASKFGLHVHSISVSSETDLITALNQDLSDADILMAIPDPQVYNRNTARAILLATFNQHIPLFAYSHSFVQAGAVLGIYSTPDQIADHVADLLRSPITLKSRQFFYPKYYSIDINQRAAEALNISLPGKSYLTKRLETDEEN